MTDPKILELLPESLGIARLPAGNNYDWVAGSFHTITQTPDELSIVCDESSIPNDVTHKKGFRALRFAGTLDFSLVGIVAKISSILADAQISILAISTYNTDYILLQESKLTKAIDALQKHGYNIKYAFDEVTQK